jgi:ring-1,2-phenylacetyl-CoA epoxidase subunit PaaD
VQYLRSTKYAITLTTVQQIRAYLDEVPDPEIPVLTIADLGIVRDVVVHPDGETEVIITPTYSGCPAMHAIEVNIRAVLQEKGVDSIRITTVLSPAWTTDWITENGRKQLLEYGIAPPIGTADKALLLGEERGIPCPQCGSKNTEMISQFGSTACKALHRCLDCREPFDYFKCH